MSDLSLDDPTVSRRHAMLSWAQGECFVSDLDSENGTTINNKLVLESVLLNDGDQVVFGAVAAEYSQEAVIGAVQNEATIRFADEGPIDRQVLLTMAEGTAAEQQERDLVRRRLRFLADLGKVVSRTFDEKTLLSFVVDELFNLIPEAERAFITLWDADSEQLIPKTARTRSGDSSELVASRTLLNEVVRTREGILVADVNRDERLATVESISKIRMLSAICVPMIFQEDLLGVLLVDSTKSGGPFGKMELALMFGIASQIGMWLANAKLHARLVERELVERDMMLARKVQQHFLPQQTPKIEGYQFNADCSPALAVGGDFYDFLHLAGGRIGIAVGDVSGKGVSAALYSAKASSDIRYLSVDQEQPAPILARVNRVLSQEAKGGMFTTLALLVLEIASGELLVSTAGHPLPLLRQRDGTVKTLGHIGSPPLGLSEDATFRQYQYQLSPSDLVVAFTDGIIEAENRDKEWFGSERFTEAIRRSDGSVESLMQTVLSAVKSFSGGEQPSDDLTLLCFSREAQ